MRTMGAQTAPPAEAFRHLLLGYRVTQALYAAAEVLQKAPQMTGAAVMGFGLAMSERYVYDPQNGLPLNRGFHDGHLPTYLDVPAMMNVAAVEKKDPQNPVGSRGIGEPAQGCADSAVLCAISDAIGGKLFNRTPVTPDMVLNAALGRPQSAKPLQQHAQ